MDEGTKGKLYPCLICSSQEREGGSNMKHNVEERTALKYWEETEYKRDCPGEMKGRDLTSGRKLACLVF